MKITRMFLVCVMANLLILKAEVEDRIGSMQMVFSGTAEAHLLAENIGVF